VADVEAVIEDVAHRTVAVFDDICGNSSRSSPRSSGEAVDHSAGSRGPTTPL